MTRRVAVTRRLTGTRVAGGIRLEAKVQTRYGLWPVAGAVTALVTGILLGIGPAAASFVGPLILVLDTATFGVFFVAVLILFERGEGAFDALTVSPLRPGEYLAVKVGLLTAMSVASAVPIGFAAVRGSNAGIGDLLLALVAVGLLAALLLTFAAAMALPYRSLPDFVARGIWPLIPLLLAPMPRVLDVWSHPLLYLVPSAGAADLVRAGVHPASGTPAAWRIVAIVGYLLAATAAAAWLARRRWTADEPTGPRGAASTSGPSLLVRRRAVGRSPLLGTHSTLARLDGMMLARDPMLVVVLVGPVLLALVLRYGYPPVETAFGLEGYRPLVAVALVVLHVPYMVGSLTALLVAEDLDSHHLTTLRASPMSMPSYLAYRLGTTAVLSLVLVLAATATVDLLPWSPGLLGAVLLASTTGPLVPLLVTAFATNRVEAMAVLKIVTLVPVGVPVAAWFLSDPLGWLLAPLPYYWVGEATWNADAHGWDYPIVIAAGLLTTLGCGLALGRRAVARLGGR